MFTNTSKLVSLENEENIKKDTKMIRVFQKKPINVKAIIWTGTTKCLLQIREFVGKGNCEYKANKLMLNAIGSGFVNASVGDYIVIDSKGYPYPCDPEVFINSHIEIIL